jgi:hypothetical protein
MLLPGKTIKIMVIFYKAEIYRHVKEGLFFNAKMGLFLGIAMLVNIK